MDLPGYDAWKTRAEGDDQPLRPRREAPLVVPCAHALAALVLPGGGLMRCRGCGETWAVMPSTPAEARTLFDHFWAAALGRR